MRGCLTRVKGFKVMTEQRRVLLIVEDDPALQKQMRWAFDGFDTVVASNREEAIAQLRRFEPPVVTMALGLPPEPDGSGKGFRLLSEMLALIPETKVIVLTGQHDRENALRAVGIGAYDFFPKPFEPDLLTLTIERAFRLHDLQQENAQLHAGPVTSLQGMLSRDPAMLKICRTIEKLASSQVTVALFGESGTGKEVLARGLDNLSARSKQRFVAIDCAAIPDALLESELFGYEKGAITGAVKQPLGKIQVAEGGTLFLDEIGDLPIALQGKFLRFLQERVIERIVGCDEIPVDVRVVCATHRDLKILIKEGRFREDLYYRLAEIVVEIPPLRQRIGDAVLLAHAFIQRFARENGRSSLALSEDAIAAIELYGWPGNVRELENVVKRAVIMAEGTRITAEDLGLDALQEDLECLNLRQVRDEAERRAVLKVLSRTNGNVARAADILGVSRPTLYDLMNRFGLKKEA